MFKEALRDVVEGTEGALAGLLMDTDGIAVDSYARDGVELDIQLVGMQISSILKDIRRASEELEVGGMREVAIQAEKVTTLVRAVNAEYYVAVAMSADGNYGKGRFLLRMAIPKMLELLS